MVRNFFKAFGAFMQTPVGVSLIVWVTWHIIMLAAHIPVNYFISFVVLGADIAITYALTDRFVYFFSQFVLPIQNPKDRQEIYIRVNTPVENRGPAIFIKNGREIAHEGESEKRGKPGVILLDTASAVVLRTDTEIKDTVGPGVKFTQADEYIAGSVDLRAQWQFIGPLASEQPFINPSPIPLKENNDTSKQSEQTSSLTRDGFKVSPTISIKFRIKRPEELRPNDSGITSQYGYDPNSVRNAVTREVVFLSKANNVKIRLDWNQLPSHLVINLWREYIRKFKLNELFTNKAGELSKLQTIEDLINQRVKQPDVMGFDDMGEPTGEWLESIEFKQLELRGLEIMEVRLQNVLFEPDVEKQTVDQWSAEWLVNARKEEKQLHIMEGLIGAAAREGGSKQFALLSSQKFGAKPTLPQENPFKTLQLLVQPIKELIYKESSSDPKIDEESRELDNVWMWLLDNNPDGAKQREGDS